MDSALSDPARSREDAGTAPDGEPQALLVRQPIVDRRQRLVAYSLSFDPVGGASPAEAVEAKALAGARMLAGLVHELGAPAVLGEAIAFVRAGARLLATEFVELLDARRTVLELEPDVEPVPEMVDRIDLLRARGFRIALQDVAAVGSAALWLPKTSFVRIDVTRALAFAPIASGNALRRHGARLMAARIDTPEQFELVHRHGFDLFEGFHFARPERLASKAVAPAYVAVLQALALAQQDAAPDRIDDALRNDVGLSFKLLRFINSAGISPGREVRSIAEAIALLGYRRLVRWLGLVLVTADVAGGAGHAQARTALTRARMMELLPAVTEDPFEAEHRFLVGLFSMLDVMLGMPMERVLERLPLPAAIADALCGRRGPLGALLRLIEDCERPRPAPGAPPALPPAEPTASSPAPSPAALPVAPASLNEAHLRALGWAEQFSAGS